MVITVAKNGIVKVSELILGYAGEQAAKTVFVNHPHFDGANYCLRISYIDDTMYDVPIENSEFTVTASMLRVAQPIKCQFIAAVQDGDTYETVMKSKVFSLVIGESLCGEPAPIPTYEEALSILDRLFSGIRLCTLTQTKYNSMQTHDKNTLYFATFGGGVQLYYGDIKLMSSGQTFGIPVLRDVAVLSENVYYKGED